MKFTKKGKVVLSVSIEGTRDNNLAEQPTNTNTELGFRISDSGIGMTQDQVGRLFDDFSEIDQAVTRKYGGTGLGLAISQRLCQLMGSSIEVSSESDKGSEFYFQVSV